MSTKHQLIVVPQFLTFSLGAVVVELNLLLGDIVNYLTAKSVVADSIKPDLSVTALTPVEIDDPFRDLNLFDEEEPPTEDEILYGFLSVFHTQEELRNIERERVNMIRTQRRQEAEAARRLAEEERRLQEARAKISCQNCGSVGIDEYDFAFSHSMITHRLCRPCAASLFRSFSHNPRPVCFYCRLPVPFSFHQELLNENFVDKVDLDRFEEKTTWNYLHSERLIVYCPNARCSAPIFTEIEGKENESCNFITCLECSQELCRHCGRTWEAHEGKTCMEVEKAEDWWTWKEERDKAGKEEEKVKKCPSCRALMEKNQGCNHMTCPCGHQFCWLCLENWLGHRDCGVAQQEDTGFGLFD